MRKSGQVQLGESIAVMIIVIILLVLLIAFWGKDSINDADDTLSQSQDLSLIEIANIVSEIPELRCYDSNIKSVKCLDYHKIIAMNIKTADKTSPTFKYYNYYFKNSKITIMQLYPTEKNITIYDAKLSNNTKNLLIQIPINIKDYVTHYTSYGVIVVEGYYDG